MMRYVVTTPEKRVVTGGSGHAYGRAVVGGIDYTVAGWGAYEIDRRNALWAVGGGESSPSSRYGGRTYIQADDAVRSVLTAVRANGDSVLQKAALRLADALGAMEDRLCDPSGEGVWECLPATALRPNQSASSFTVPPMTSADLRAFAADPEQEADLESMYELSEDVTAVVAAVGGPVFTAPPPVKPAPPPLPTRIVSVTNDEKILRLEAAVAPYVASLEEVQAALATKLDTAATTITQALTRKRE